MSGKIRPLPQNYVHHAHFPLSLRANHLAFPKLRFSSGFGMIRDLLKWVAPGVATILGGTAAALAMTTPGVLDTLALKGRASLLSSGAQWAHVTLDGRRAHLFGTTSTESERDIALAALLALDGITAVDETITIAPLATPYRINVAVEDGVVSLYGSVPNESLRRDIEALSNLAQVDLQIRSGQPDEALWRQGLDFALAQTAYVENGLFELSGLTLNAVGRANSEKALGHLQMALAEVPDGLSLGQIQVEPVLVTPYTWRAEFDGQRIAISGHVPEERLADRLRMADVSGIPVATGLSLASGAPEGFAAQTRLLIEQLARLERGEARIMDGTSHLTGIPASVEVAQAVTEALSGTNSIVELSPPRIADYWVSINRQAGGTLVFDGYVPDEATRDGFSAITGADVSFLRFGAGAPEGYGRGVDFGLLLLARMSEGRFAMNGKALSVSGEAASPTEYRGVLDLLESALPQGLDLAEVDIHAPRAANYVFTARKHAGNGIALSGMVPNPAVETALLAQSGTGARSKLTFASGEAPNFVASAEQALSFLTWLRNGEVSFDGTGWSVEGEPMSLIDKGSIETEFAMQGLAQAGWSLALSTPPAMPGFADPYLWSAEKLADGSFLFAGNVPAPALQAYLKVHVGARVADTTAVSHGAPPDFPTSVRAAIDALMVLEKGRASFDGTSWTLVGNAASAEQHVTALALIAGLDLAQEAEISIPQPSAAEPYTWSAARSPAGIALSGSVPAESLQKFLAVRAGADSQDETVLRSDAPEGFASDVLQAMDILALLDEGEVGFDGARWYARGLARSAGSAVAVQDILGTAAPRWTIAVSDPETEAAEVEAQTVPTVEPSPEAAPAPAAATEPQAYSFSATRATDGSTALSGQVPSEATLNYLSSLPGVDASALALQPAVPDNFILPLRDGMRALMQLDQGQLDYAEGNWRLIGEAPSQDARSSIGAQLADLGVQWSLGLSAPSGLEQCQTRLAELSAHNAILFQSGAAIISASAAAELDAFAQVLLLCPDAIVDVEGHTDSDGDDRLNLALSVARAEAVVTALIERGVSPARLYAIGYGETQPVADNATSDGKRRNRRIVVSVRAAAGQG